jgi:capsular polysaccharide biosynthesis protein
MEETISLQDLFKTLKKRLGLIALITVIAITISGVISYLLLTPIYQSSTQILVTTSKQDQQQQQNNAQDIQANLQLINTYNVIIKSPAILGIVKEEMNLDRSVGALINQVTVNSEQNSQVVNISVQDEDPKMAVELANKIATVFQNEIKALMSVDNVNILTPAELGVNPSPVKPDPKLNMAIAAVIGLMLGVGLAFLLEYLDTTMKDEQDVEEILNIPIIGLISPIPDSDIKKMKVEVTQRRRGRGRG